MVLVGLPWNYPVVPCIFMGPLVAVDGTSSQAHQLTMRFMDLYGSKEGVG